MEHSLQNGYVVKQPLTDSGNTTLNTESIASRIAKRENIHSATLNTKKLNSNLTKCMHTCDTKEILSCELGTDTLLETKSPVKNIRVGATFEPTTPQAHIEFSLELKKVINERNILTSKTRTRVFEALDEIKTKSEEESRKFKREKSLLEIVNSEIKYVHQLEIIIHFFMKPVQERKLLKPDDFEILFGNISTIYNVNKKLLEELDKGVDNITKAFSKIAPFLKLYSVYAYEFKNILKILQNARALYPQFATFVENQESRPEVQSKLSALLITPIQRVPRYKLLLTNLQQLTKTSDKDSANLMDCLEKIDDAAEHINKIVEDQENMQRLLELQRCLCSGEPNVITPGRKLIREGILMKISTKNAYSEKLYVVLMNDIIMFNKMKKHEPKVNSLKCLSIFPLSKCKVVEVLDKGCLRIICQEEELILYHNQFSVTKTWIKQIKDSIESHLNDRKTLKKESSSRRPVKRKDLYEYHETGVSPGRPLKKRKVTLEDNSNIYASDHKMSKRKIIPIKEINSAPAVITSGNNVTNNDNPKKELVESHQKTETSKDLFVFRKSYGDSPFRLGRIWEGIGSTIKKFFSFKN